MTIHTVIYAIIFIALVFDFMNGFHDAANSVATIVSTKVLTPRQAVAWAAFFNFIAFLFFGLHVANTIGQGVVDNHLVTVGVILSALLAGIIWDILTWYFGLPSSSMHALVGALCGAIALKAGFSALHASGILKVVISIFLSPAIGFALAYLIVKIERSIFKRASPARVDMVSRKLQLVSAALYSLGHGGNDAQKTMGVIAMLLFAAGLLHGEFHIPFWVVIACHAAMALGTFFGGWRIIRTMGEKLVKLTPETGCCAETGGAITIFIATRLGIPVSTTHTIAGSIVGVGAVESAQKVNWPIVRQIVTAWIVTLPAAACLAAGLWWFIGDLQ